MSKELSRIMDPDELDLEDCKPAYLILFDKKTRMYRVYHADIPDMVVIDDDPLIGLQSLIDTLSEETTHEADERYN